MPSPQVSAIRQAVFSRKHAVPTRLVTSKHLPDVTLAMRALTLGERRAMLALCKDDETGKLDGVKMIPAAVIACATDPVTGEQVFTPGDFDSIDALPAVVVDDWAGPALDLNGLGDSAVGDAEKNSATTPSSSTSSSSSPAASAAGPSESSKSA